MKQFFTFRVLLAIGTGTAFWSLWSIIPALSAECPPNAPKCKVLILTPEEEQALAGPNGILDIAEKGAFVALGGAVRYFREKIANAPAGDAPASGKKPDPVPAK